MNLITINNSMNSYSLSSSGEKYRLIKDPISGKIIIIDGKYEPKYESNISKSEGQEMNKIQEKDRVPVKLV